MVAATKPTNIDHIFTKKPENIQKEKPSEVKTKEDKVIGPEVPPQSSETVKKDEKAEFKTPLPNPDDTQKDKGDKDVFKVPQLPKRPAEPEPETSISISTSEPGEKEEADKSESKYANIPAGYGLIQRKDLQALKNNELLAKKRRIQKDEESDFFEDPKDTRDEKMEIQPEPEDNAVWVPPSGQTGDGWTKLNEKFGGRY